MGMGLRGYRCTWLLCGLWSGHAAAIDPEPGKPVLEVGVAGGGAYVPDYPASGHSQITGLVLPYAIYRGEVFRADQDGLRGKLSLLSRWEFNVGADASFSAKSSDNPQRRGMPNLDYLLEIGPSVEYHLVDVGSRSLSAITQLRAAFAASLKHISYTGYALEPQLVYRDRNFLLPGLHFTTGLSVKFADDGLNGYFYTVKPQYVTATRPAFDGRAGYQQTALSTSFYLPLTPRLTISAANQLLFYGGAANRDSPLYRKNFNYAFGLGLAYSFYLSDDKVGDR